MALGGAATCAPAPGLRAGLAAAGVGASIGVPALAVAAVSTAAAEAGKAEPAHQSSVALALAEAFA